MKRHYTYEIENFVDKLSINGFSDHHFSHMRITVKALGKTVKHETSGSDTIGDIVNNITDKLLKKEIKK